MARLAKEAEERAAKTEQSSLLLWRLRSSGGTLSRNSGTVEEDYNDYQARRPSSCGGRTVGSSHHIRRLSHGCHRGRLSQISQTSLGRPYQLPRALSVEEVWEGWVVLPSHANWQQSSTRLLLRTAAQADPARRREHCYFP